MTCWVPGGQGADARCRASDPHPCGRRNKILMIEQMHLMIALDRKPERKILLKDQTRRQGLTEKAKPRTTHEDKSHVSN
jgi:hypothetical protein